MFAYANIVIMKIKADAACYKSFMPNNSGEEGSNIMFPVPFFTPPKKVQCDATEIVTCASATGTCNGVLTGSAAGGLANASATTALIAGGSACAATTLLSGAAAYFFCHKSIDSDVELHSINEEEPLVTDAAVSKYESLTIHSEDEMHVGAIDFTPPSAGPSM